MTASSAMSSVTIRSPRASSTLDRLWYRRPPLAPAATQNLQSRPTLCPRHRLGSGLPALPCLIRRVGQSGAPVQSHDTSSPMSDRPAGRAQQSSVACPAARIRALLRCSTQWHPVLPRIKEDHTGRPTHRRCVPSRATGKHSWCLETQCRGLPRSVPAIQAQ